MCARGGGTACDTPLMPRLNTRSTHKHAAVRRPLVLQIVAHKVDGYNAAASANAVDGDPVPVPHFGAALSVPHFHELAGRLKAAGVAFIIEPHLRFTGQPGEQVGTTACSGSCDKEAVSADKGKKCARVEVSCKRPAC